MFARMQTKSVGADGCVVAVGMTAAECLFAGVTGHVQLEVLLLVELGVAPVPLTLVWSLS